MFKRKVASGTTLTLLLIGMLMLTFSIQPIKAAGTIYIRADGSVDPPTAPISSVDNVTYTFTGDVFESIEIERDNIVVDGAGYRVQGRGSGNGISLSGRSHVTIRNMEVQSFGENGVYLKQSSNVRIIGNNITNNYRAIWSESSSNNIMSGNNITNNLSDGIFLLSSLSERNIISGNNIINNDAGITLFSSSNNKISRNNITNNAYGILLIDSDNNDISGNNITANTETGIYFALFSSNNIIYHNSFLINGIQVYFDGFSYANFWDDGYPSGGNYWSDYTDVDLYSGPEQNELGNDGVWDHPYVIDAVNRDRYPLVPPADIAVVNVVPSPTEIYIGQVVNVDVVVRNEGDFPRTFEVTCRYTLEGVEHTIGTQIINLPPNADTTLTFTWTTTDVTVHIVKAEIPPLPGETDTADNTMASQITVKVKMLGDVNNDNKVDGKDITPVAKAFGAFPMHPRWNPQTDLNQDNRIDGKDITIVAKNFGKRAP